MDQAMRLRLLAGLVWLATLWWPGHPAHALQFEPVPISATEVIVGGHGPIVKGDADRLRQAVAAVPQGRLLLALALDSPGGNVVEGERLAELIRARRLPVVIPSDSKCVSACFLLLAASPRRFAASDALIGVHSASENGEETGTSLAVTTLMARDASALGIPAAIVGKMVRTTPGQVEWLTRDDLASMNVTVFDGDALAATRQAGAATVRPAAPAPVPPPVQPQAVTAPGFAAGRDDRRLWNAWLGGLRGAYRDGAVFAHAQLGVPQPASCYGPNGVNRGDFTLGCEIAQQRLLPVTARIRANTDYAAGWHGADPQIPAGTPPEVEYQGAYFCGRQMARFTLKVFPQAGEPRRRAMLSFGPQPTSPDVPRGAFIVEGLIELRGGAMTLTPVQWVLQPAGYDWLGLSGRSDDGGGTFSGRVIDSRACTIFTLKRIGGTSVGR
jgi:hypothetical protein